MIRRRGGPGEQGRESTAEEERCLTQVEIALNRLRLAAFTALEVGASRDQVADAIAEAQRVLDRRSNPTKSVKDH